MKINLPCFTLRSRSTKPSKLKLSECKQKDCLQAIHRLIRNEFLLFCLTGCILAELYTGYPLFPGENEVEQLACIMELLGTPPDDLINQATRRRLFFGKLAIFMNFTPLTDILPTNRLERSSSLHHKLERT